VATCFLFSQQFDEEKCLSLRLDQAGEVEAPLALRSIEECRTLQADARTIVVMPADVSSVHEIELPWLGERKARAAIPYALEDHLAQNVNTLHFAFDRQYYQNNHYLVAVIDKQLLTDLIARLQAVNLKFDVITLDWFALKEHEACITQTTILAHDHTFKGSLSAELAAIYLNNRPLTTEVLVFADSNPQISSNSFTPIDSACNVWVAKRLARINAMNLGQGELQQSSGKQTSVFWYQASAVLFGIWLITLITTHAIQLYSLTSKNKVFDQQIAVIYREFFPQAQQVISPKFRITQLLKSNVATEQDSLWQLLDKLSQALVRSQITIEQLRFQNPMLAVTLTSKDFAALEKLQVALRQAKVKVEQTQASSHEQQVVATLELSL